MRKRNIICLILISVLLLCGCQMRTVDEMYVPPKRSDDFYSLQTVINNAMTDLQYSAPISGENQQIVQTADLNGDDVMECILFAKGGSQMPLQILIFSMENGEYVHSETIKLPGTAFDKVEYAKIDSNPGVELIVGSQVSDQVSRSVYVYSFAQGEAQQLVTEDYVSFLTCDLDSNGKSEIFVLRSGSTETDRGIVELFSVYDGVMERSVELNMSETSSKLRRILSGQLQDGKPAVYVASAVDEDTLITDVYAIVNGFFTNVSLSGDSETSVKTMRNYFVYADDIDSDGIIELPSLIRTRSIDTARPDSGQNLIRWYSVTSKGEQVDKLYTYHHFIGGWYLQIDRDYSERISVVDLGNICDFYVWDQETPIKVLSIHTLTGQSREVQSTSDNRFPLYKAESTIYSAEVYEYSARYNFTQEAVLRSFFMIRENWYTGET